MRVRPIRYYTVTKTNNSVKSTGLILIYYIVLVYCILRCFFCVEVVAIFQNLLKSNIL